MSAVDDAVSALEDAGIDFVCAIPCISISDFIEAVEGRLPSYQVTREEEAVGICAGAYLAGKRSCIIMQNTGLGNSVTALKSLIELYSIPLVLIVSHRGQEGEAISGQVPMGKATEGLLDSLGIHHLSPAVGEVARAITDCARDASDRGRASVVLIGQGVLS